MRNPSSSSSSKAQVVVAAATTGSKTTPCCTKVGIKRGPWTPEEDELLANCIRREGEGRWRALPNKAGLLRCSKSCRLRWMNYLRPSVKRGHIAPDEEDLILRLHRLSKKLISQGIDPRTHKPLEPSSNNENKASSSKGNQILAPREPNSSYAPLVENAPNGSSTPPIIGGGIKHDDHFQRAAMTVRNDNENAQNGTDGDDYGMDLKSSHEGLSNDDDEIEDINYCTDDILSSFLNSLINEDAFTSQNLVQQQQLQPNNAMNATNCDALISSTPTFTFGPGWDVPVIASTSSFDQNESKRLNDHVEKHF